MSNYQIPAGFRRSNAAQPSRMAQQQQPQQQQEMYDDHQPQRVQYERDDYGNIRPIAYLNIRLACDDGQARQLGQKGLALMPNRAVDRGIVETFFNEDGSRTEYDINELIGDIELSIELANGQQIDIKPAFLRRALEQSIAAEQSEEVAEQVEVDKPKPVRTRTSRSKAAE